MSDAAAISVQQHSPELGAETIVAIVQSWSQAGVPASEIAVLTRVNSLLLAPFVGLAEAGVPVIVPVSPDMLERTGVEPRWPTSGWVPPPTDCNPTTCGKCRSSEPGLSAVSPSGCSGRCRSTLSEQRLTDLTISGSLTSS